jgi:hypothetical protein
MGTIGVRSMTVPEALEKISKALGILAHQTSAENLGGLFSKNRLTEDLLLPLFKIALESPSLRNVNQDRQNFPGIDLADDGARLAVQVTTDASAGKITETLKTFFANDLPSRYDRLVIFHLTDRPPRYTVATKAKWRRVRARGRRFRFDPTRDVITTTSLFRTVQGLPHGEIYKLSDVLAQSIIGERFIDVSQHLKTQSRRQLESEKKWGKYIPDIFIETRETKNLARSFLHPTLFVHRTLESLRRINIPGCNRFLTRSGLPPLPAIRLQPRTRFQNLDAALATADELLAEVQQVSEPLKRYEKFRFKDPPPGPITKQHRPFYDANFYLLPDWGWGLGHSLADIAQELNAARARVFILTGRAGQGKTNFVCDLVENFLWRHEIPCAYTTGRRISAIHAPELADVINKLIFQDQVSSFSEAAGLLAEHASRSNKPFVLIIDGLNEHHRISEFAVQLEQFIEAMLEYPHLKVLLTCRSEFFRQRFGRLTSGPIGSHVFVLEANEQHLEDEAYEEMLAGYFKFFGIAKDRISDQVMESLKRDILLLRFFCEAYGSRGKVGTYRQPWIAAIYRDQIFQIYLEKKLGTADAFLQRITGGVNPIDPKGELIAVLESVLQHMLSTWRFTDVPSSVVPTTLRPALYALLDEELILRQDVPASDSVFTAGTDTINFTFDEFRDFLLAQYMVHRVFATDRGLFDEYVARSDPKESQTVEGIKRFMFYASRRPSNESFWQFYRGHSWYRDVYDVEVFNIDVGLLRVEDQETVRDALRAGGPRAQAFSRDLAIRWHPIHCPVLNLDLLLSIIIAGDDKVFDELVVSTFKRGYHNEGYSCRAFCEFVAKEVIPKFDPTRGDGHDALFKFLVLLLPVDAMADLNSESGLVLRQLLEQHPDYAVSLLRRSLQYAPTRHRAFVWRLLATASGVATDPELVAEATLERERSAALDSVLHGEVSRFLEKAGAHISLQAQ